MRHAEPLRILRTVAAVRENALPKDVGTCALRARWMVARPGPYFFLGSGAAAGAPFTTLSCLGFFVFFLPLSPIDCLHTQRCYRNGTPSAGIRQTSYPGRAGGVGMDTHACAGPGPATASRSGPGAETAPSCRPRSQCAGLESRPSARCQYGTQPRAITLTVMFCLVGLRMIRSSGWLSGSKSAVMRATSA